MNPGEETGRALAGRTSPYLANWQNNAVRLTVALKLLPTPDQASLLETTLARANDAANLLSAIAWEQRTFGRFALHRLAYACVRAGSGLTAQVVVRLIAKVADAYKLDRQRQRVFRRRGSIAYDDRVLRYHADAVSIWTVGGREHVPFVCGARQRALLASRQGESDLVLRDGGWYLYATVNLIEPPASEAVDYLGVDLGVVNLAVDSDGTVHAGGQVSGLRRRHHRVGGLDLHRPAELVVLAPPLSDPGVLGHAPEHPAEGRRVQHRRDVQDRVLPDPPVRVGRAERPVRLVERGERPPEGVLHPPAPGAVEHPLEDPQGRLDGLVPLPSEPHIEQVQAEGPLALGRVEVDDVVAPVGRDEPEDRLGQVAVRVDEQQRRARPAGFASLHHVAGDPEQDRGLAAPGLGDQQQVPGEQLVGQVDRDGPTLVGRDADPAAARDRLGQRQPLAGGGPL